MLKLLNVLRLLKNKNVCDLVIKQVDANPVKFKLVIEGKDVSVRRARTRRATERTAALRGAADTLKKLAEMETDVKIEWGHEGKTRGVIVKGSFMFSRRIHVIALELSPASLNTTIC